MNKKVASEIAVGIILILVLAIGGVFWMQGKNTGKAVQMISQPLSDSRKANNISSNLIQSDYGINFSVPAGWHIWEESSSVFDLSNKTDFASVLESGVSALTVEKIKSYQSFMDNWKVESSEGVVFTDSKTIDYKSRSFSNAGKIMSRIVDSEDSLKQRDITMNISTAEINMSEPFVNDETREGRSVKIDGKDARLTISKKMKFVDMIIVRMPINSNKTILDKKVSSLFFMGYIKKNDPSAVDSFISFISSLKISDNL